MVEDVPEDRKRISSLLRSLAFDPVESDQADEVVQAVSRWSPKAILLSADMPRGFTACHRLKKDKALRRIPVILVSGSVGPDVIRKHQMLPTRADHYLSKPLDPDGIARALAELLPEDFQEPVREVAVTELPDRTLVGGGLESAVVTYVEEEVSSLKSRLNAKVQALEEQLAQERARLDAALRALAEHQEAEREALARERIEAAREEGRREAREEARAQLEGWQARVAELEAALEASRQQAEALRAEMAQNQVLFERLEAGYKESIAAAEEEKGAMEATLAALESQVESLKAERDAAMAGLRDLPELQEKAARCEMLEEELRQVRAEKEEVEQRVATLESEVEALRAALAETAALEAGHRALTEELQATREALAREEQARRSAEEALSKMRSQQEEMRAIFQRLKAVWDEGADG